MSKVNLIDPPPPERRVLIELSLNEAQTLRRTLGYAISATHPLRPLYRQLGEIPGVDANDY